MEWKPKPNIIVLEAGDEGVSHTGSTGDLRVEPPKIREVPESELSDEMRAALENLDFGDWETTED